MEGRRRNSFGGEPAHIVSEDEPALHDVVEDEPGRPKVAAVYQLLPKQAVQGLVHDHVGSRRSLDANFDAGAGICQDVLNIGHRQLKAGVRQAVVELGEFIFRQA